MNTLLSALKEDLLDRRMRLLLAAVAIGLVGSLYYASQGGSGGPAPAAGGEASVGGAAVAAPSVQQSGIANPQAASAETTYGGAYQHHSALVDPFILLPSKAAKRSAAPSAGGSSKHATSSPGSASHSGSGSGGATPGASTAPPPVKMQPKTVYVVDVELGKAPAKPEEAPHLVLYKNIQPGHSIPSKVDALAVLKSASLDTKALTEGRAKASATFTLNDARAPIVNGPGTCQPSATQCEALRLAVGQSEELGYLEANGQTVTYLLKLTLVAKKTVLEPVKG